MSKHSIEVEVWSDCNLLPSSLPRACLPSRTGEVVETMVFEEPLHQPSRGRAGVVVSLEQPKQICKQRNNRLDVKQEKSKRLYRTTFFLSILRMSLQQQRNFISGSV